MPYEHAARVPEDVGGVSHLMMVQHLLSKQRPDVVMVSAEEEKAGP